MEKPDINILVIDDVNTLRAQLKDILKSAGFRKVFVCETTQAAMQAIEDERFDLVLCDWHVGMHNGLEFLKYVRQHPEAKDMPFIMITAESTKELVLEAVKSGVDDYIVKPITMGHVDKIYKVLLKKKVMA